MALWTDSDFVTQNDLAAADPQILRVAQAENITLDSVISETITECQHELLARSQTFGGFYGGFGIGSGHIAAVMNTGGGRSNASRAYFRMSNVVVSANYPGQLSLVQRWVRNRAIDKCYRMASNLRVNDRYLTRMEQFQEEEKASWAQLLDIGLPLIGQVLPCPAAVREVNPGRWSTDNVTDIAGSATGGGYYVAITYTASALYVDQNNKRNGESGPSAIVYHITNSSEVLKVDITSLNPPVSGQAPQIGMAEGLTTYLQATGWNVWVGTDPTAMYLQNSNPIAIATKTYMLSGDPTLSGYMMGTGQVGEYNFAFGSKRVLRG
jgi:hypothetical protein